MEIHQRPHTSPPPSLQQTSPCPSPSPPLPAGTAGEQGAEEEWRRERVREMAVMADLRGDAPATTIPLTIQARGSGMNGGMYVGARGTLHDPRKYFDAATQRDTAHTQQQAGQAAAPDAMDLDGPAPAADSALAGTRTTLAASLAAFRSELAAGGSGGSSREHGKRGGGGKGGAAAVMAPAAAAQEVEEFGRQVAVARRGVGEAAEQSLLKQLPDALRTSLLAHGEAVKELLSHFWATYPLTSAALLAKVRTEPLPTPPHQPLCPPHPVVHAAPSASFHLIASPPMRLTCHAPHLPSPTHHGGQAERHKEGISKLYDRLQVTHALPLCFCCCFPLFPLLLCCFFLPPLLPLSSSPNTHQRFSVFPLIFSHPPSAETEGWSRWGQPPPAFTAATALLPGALAATALLPGALGATALLPGALAATALLPGALAATSLLPGALAATALLPGALAATALLPGALAATALLPGALAATAILPGALAATALLPGALAATAILPGALAATALLPGALAATALLPGALAATALLPGALAATALLPGALAATALLPGALAATALLPGALAATALLPGALAATALLPGALAATALLPGALAATALLPGALAAAALLPERAALAHLEGQAGRRSTCVARGEALFIQHSAVDTGLQGRGTTRAACVLCTPRTSLLFPLPFIPFPPFPPTTTASPCGWPHPIPPHGGHQSLDAALAHFEADNARRQQRRQRVGAAAGRAPMAVGQR
ncbi:unnamed protein product [Closterium sp. NIES-65]|nr:unnamed protein product [Closterium sp. NIES-65]